MHTLPTAGAQSILILLNENIRKIGVHFHVPGQTVRGERESRERDGGMSLGCGYLADKLCIKTAQVARDRVFR